MRSACPLACFLLVGCSAEVLDLGPSDALPDAGVASDAGFVEPCEVGFVEGRRIEHPARLVPVALVASVTAQPSGFHVALPIETVADGRPASGVAGLRYAREGGEPTPLFVLMESVNFAHAIFERDVGYAIAFSSTRPDFRAVAYYVSPIGRARSSGTFSNDLIRGTVQDGDGVAIFTHDERRLRRRIYSMEDPPRGVTFDLDLPTPTEVVTVDGVDYVAYDAEGDVTGQLGVAALDPSGSATRYLVQGPDEAQVVHAAAFGREIALLFRQDDQLRVAAFDPATRALRFGADIARAPDRGFTEFAAVDGAIAVAYAPRGAAYVELFVFDADLAPLAGSPFLPNVVIKNPRLGMSLAGHRGTFALTTSSGEDDEVEHALALFEACTQ